jgi:selenocysteine-specific elongation factor
MPQTREHVAVCRFLGVEAGVVALTKCDLAPGDLLALVEEDIRQATAGTFLEAAPIVRCSALAAPPVGLAELTAATARALHRRAERSGAAFLAVDRVFTKAGAGTVVTGTLARGSVSVGDELEVFPPGHEAPLRVHVRALQVHGRSEPKASAAARVALALRGDDLAAIERGSVVAAPGSLAPTRVVDVELDLLSGEPLAARTALRLHLGTTALDVTARPLGDRYARLSSRLPFVALAGQRFVVRESDRTVGGGRVVDPEPRVVRFRARSRPRPWFFEEPPGRARVARLVEEARYAGLTPSDASRRTGIADAPTHLTALSHRGEVVLASDRAFAAPLLAEAKATLLALALEHHAEKPILAGVSGAELATRAPARLRALAPRALEALVVDGSLTLADGRYRAHGSDAARQELLGSLLERFRRARLEPPLDEVARTEAGLEPKAFRDALAELQRSGSLRRVGGLHFESGALQALADDVRRWFSTHTELSAGDLKTLGGGLSRKYAIPLLEWLDQEGVTLRRGDVRIAGPARRS